LCSCARGRPPAGHGGIFFFQARLATRSGRRDVFWAAHYVGVERAYCQIERLMNQDRLPPAIVANE
jgi:hypothetical protein